MDIRSYLCDKIGVSNVPKISDQELWKKCCNADKTVASITSIDHYKRLINMIGRSSIHTIYINCCSSSIPPQLFKITNIYIRSGIKIDYLPRYLIRYNQKKMCDYGAYDSKIIKIRNISALNFRKYCIFAKQGIPIYHNNIFAYPQN